MEGITNPRLGPATETIAVRTACAVGESLIAGLLTLGIAGEITGRPRSRIFSYASDLAILDEGTEPLSA